MNKPSFHPCGHHDAKQCIYYAASLLIFYCTSCLVVHSQPPAPDSQTVDWKVLYQSVVNEYGADQVLLTGISYEDVYREKEGHPFLFEDQFYKGTLVFRGREYKEVNLKYDIYNQQVILYSVQNHSSTWIIPPNDFISAFSLGDKWFVKYTFLGEPEFYQVIFDTQRLKCLYHWSKSRYDSDHQNNYYGSRFTDSEKTTCLFLENVLKKYDNNKSFIKCFPKESHLKIKQYLKSNRIKISKCSEDRLVPLLTFCITML